MFTVDGMVDDDACKRFAALGMRAVETPDPALPLKDVFAKPDGYLVSDAGVTGRFYTGKSSPRRLETASLWRLYELVVDYSKKFPGFRPPETDTVEDFLFMFERFGDLMEKWRMPRERVGSVYALACNITLPPFNRPRKMRTVAKTVQALAESDVDMVSFYDMLARLGGAKALERTTAAVAFQQEHGLNWALVQEMFA